MKPKVGQVWYCYGVRPDTVTRISRTRWKGRRHVWVHLKLSMTMTVKEFLKMFKPIPVALGEEWKPQASPIPPGAGRG